MIASFQLQFMALISSLTKQINDTYVRVHHHQIWMQTRLTTAASYNDDTSAQQLLRVEDEAASDGAGEASPSLSNGGNHNDGGDGKQRRTSSNVTAPPARENGGGERAELPAHKTRVSVRARSEAPMVTNTNNLIPFPCYVDLLKETFLIKNTVRMGLVWNRGEAWELKC
jgi:hypothetical protein